MVVGWARPGVSTRGHTSHLSRNYGPRLRVSWSFPKGEGRCKKKMFEKKRKEKQKKMLSEVAASVPSPTSMSESNCLFSSAPRTALGVAFCLRCLSRKNERGSSSLNSDTQTHTRNIHTCVVRHEGPIFVVAIVVAISHRLEAPRARAAIVSLSYSLYSLRWYPSTGRGSEAPPAHGIRALRWVPVPHRVRHACTLSHM